MKKFTALLFVLLTGCAVDGLYLPEYRIIPPSGASPKLMNVLWEGSRDWNEALGQKVFTVGFHDDVPAYGDINVELVRVEDMKPAGWTTSTPTNDGFVIRLRVDYQAHPNCFRHELGHTLGLLDIDDPSDVMFKRLLDETTRSELSEWDVQTVYDFFNPAGR